MYQVTFVKLHVSQYFTNVNGFPIPRKESVKNLIMRKKNIKSQSIVKLTSFSMSCAESETQQQTAN